MNELDSYAYRPADPPWWPGDEAGYDEYHRQRYLLTRLTSGFVRWKILSSGMNAARQLAGARNLGRASWEREHGGDPERWPLPHPPAVIWFPSVAHAACLRCMWLGSSTSDLGAAASEGRRHAATSLSFDDHDALVRLLQPVPVWHRALDEEAHPPAAAG